MADIALGGVERIVRLGLAIKEAPETARRNRKECRDIERCVARVRALLSLLHDHESSAAMMDHPAIRGPLDDLAESVQEALELVMACREPHALLRFLGAGDMARQLRRVQDDILRKLALQNFASAVHVTITLTSIVPSPYGGVHRPLQLGGAALTEGMASRCELPCASSSSGFCLPEFEASMHHFTGGGTKQKIVIRVSMKSARSRSKAMTLAARLDGVSSTAICGDDKDRLEVVGDGIDAVLLVQLLRNKFGHSDLLKVKELKQVIRMPEELAGGDDAAAQ